MVWSPGRWEASAFLAVFLQLTPTGAFAQWVFGDGFENACEVDTDGDRLSDCEEALHGTQRKVEDTDADGLSDGDEVLGTESGLNLPTMGVDPLHKDLLLEIDWAVDSRNCATHSHKPSPAIIDAVVESFASVPLDNPDGEQGLRLIVDMGQGGVFDGGAQVPLPLGQVPAPDTPAFNAFRAEHSDPRRIGYFHYQVHAHAFEGGGSSSGSSEIGGDDTVVTMLCKWTRSDWWRNTMLHELGHNLGLRHGGDTNCNYKPNYNSLMNYAYQFDGTDADCDTLADGEPVYGFSSGSLITLDATKLIEAAGVCPLQDPAAQAVDWNHNGIIDADPIAWYLPCSEYGPVSDHDDFAAISVSASLPRFGHPILESVVCGEVP